MPTVDLPPANPLHALPFGSLDEITDGETLLVLLSRPADESLDCGGLIASLCRRGRPPHVVVLTDGVGLHPRSAQHLADRLAAQCERETRAAVQRLGLPTSRLLMAGLPDGAIPEDGPVFEAVVNAVTMVMWARDCNLVCAPWPSSPLADDRASYRIASAVARRSGVGLRAHAARSRLLAPDMQLPEEAIQGWRLDIGAHLSVKQEAISSHAIRPDQGGQDRDVSHSAAGQRPYEILLRPSPEV